MVQSNLEITDSISQMIQAMQQSNAQVLDTIKSQQQTPPLNWTPLIQAIATAIPAVVGVPVQIATPMATPTPQTPTTPAAPASKVVPPAETAMLTSRMDKLEILITQQSKVLETMSSTVSQLSQGFNTLSGTVSQQGTTISQLSQGFNTLSQIVAASSGIPSNGSNSSNGSSTPPAAPQESGTASSPSSNTTSKNSRPLSLPEISILRPVSENKNFNSKVVTADLEAIIDPNGQNIVYMAAWYNGIDHNILDISQWGYNTNTMLEQFWIDLINSNLDKVCYFHNWGGYDAILSMVALLNLPGYTFDPIVKNGEIMCLFIYNKKGKTILTIKDSIRILPGALGKLAKDWKVETQKDHFPHYFFLNDLKSTLNYIGSVPPYSCFEYKRTSDKDYQDLASLYPNNNGSFLKVSRHYILGDCKALFQIIVSYFEAIASKFPIDPLSIMSAPSAAFKIWRTVQLPLLHKEHLKVYDFSYKNLDSQLRNAYLGEREFK
jgi:hypothetical protein